MQFFFPVFLALSILVYQSRCHCPHMMGMKTEKPSGPSAPGNFPEGDEGWDYDEAAAPGILPDPHFIQSTYVYRSPNAQEKQFSTRVINVLRDLRERLAKNARLTLENENIECNSPEDHYRCQEFENSGAWNYLIVEDEKKGAFIYTFERKNNEKNDGTIEMALLDAFSRHSPNSLIAFASPEAEKEVGFIRELSNSELKSLGKPTHKLSIEKFGPNEMNLVDGALLEVRTGSYLKEFAEKLVEFDTPQHFDEHLEKHQFVFVLFWNKNRMISLHTFNLWSNVAKKLDSIENAIFSHVACHKNADFCQGLNSQDYQTIVAYKNGKNIGKIENIGDEEYYIDWIEIMMNGPLQKIAKESELSNFKKGNFLSKNRKAVTIGIFPNEDDTSFRHFQIAAEKLFGKYYLAYYFSDKPESSVSTYRTSEKQKRTDYKGRFDPATLMEFISTSSLPNILDISTGFSTDMLLRQKRPILLEIVSSEPEQNYQLDSTPFAKLASRQDAHKSYSFVRVFASPSTQKTIDALDVTEYPMLVLLNKDRVHHIRADKPKCPDHLLRLLQIAATSESTKVLSTKDPHPLRYLQVERVNTIFGHEESIVLPDQTLFLDSDPFSSHQVDAANPSGGCPFMQGGGGGASHDEL